MSRSASLLALCLLASLGSGLTACSSGAPKETGPSAPPARSPAQTSGRSATAGSLDMVEFRNAWQLFTTKDPRWPDARDAWLAKGPRATTLLAENLFRYFWGASKGNHRAEINRVAHEAKAVGAPATDYFVRALVTDRWPLSEPVTVKVFNPDNPNVPLSKTYTHFDMDDLTRQHAAYVLAGIGAPAVPALVSNRVMRAKVASARRYGAYALGAIGTDEAVRALDRMLRGSGDWQERGAAAKGLGFALKKNPLARASLERAMRDPDEFVRRKAKEGLEGRTRIEF